MRQSQPSSESGGMAPFPEPLGDGGIGGGLGMGAGTGAGPG